MYRNLEGIISKNYDATKTAKVAMKVGMGVVIDGTEVKFPTSATATDIFFVGKEFIPTGIDSLKGDISDYDLEGISIGEYVKLEKPIIGERFWTDQCDTVEVGDYLVVGTDGKFEAGATSAKSNLVVRSITDKDAGSHSGVTIEVVDLATISA